MATASTNLKERATEAFFDADFRSVWPIEVRKAIVRAINHEGEFPPYAVGIVTRALNTAKAVESRMNRQIAAGNSTLSQADKKRLGER